MKYDKIWGKWFVLPVATVLALSLTACSNGTPAAGVTAQTATATVNVPESNTPLTTAVPAPTGTMPSSPTTQSLPATVLAPATQTALPGGTTTGTTAPITVVTPGAGATALSTEGPVAPETNPVGDIPDTQAFVKYSSAQGGYEFEAPEGWARTESGPNVSFLDKLDGVAVVVTHTVSPPTLDNIQATWIPNLSSSGRAVQVVSAKQVKLTQNSAILVSYTSNSEPNQVTGKQVRLENNAYLFYKGGNLAVLTMWAPVGADNVDQWQRMSQSFVWR